MKKKILSLIFLFIVSVQAFSENPLNISLELHPKKIAYPLKGNKIFILTFKNNTSIPQNVTLSDDYVHNIEIEGFDDFDVSLPVKSSILKQRSNPKILYRTLTLLPDEKFSFEIDIDDYFVFSSPGTYKIYLRYYPHFYKDKNLSQQYISSNTLVISVVDFMPSLFKDAQQDEIFLEENPSYAERVLYQPNEIVFYAFSALKEKAWETFFSFLDIKKFYLNTISDSTTFSFLSTAQQKTELKKFKERIKKGTERSDLSKIDYFSIEETQFTKSHANVEVLTQDRRDAIVIIKKYTIRLMKIHNIWRIIDYDIGILARHTRVDKSNPFGNKNGFITPDEVNNDNK